MKRILLLGLVLVLNLKAQTNQIKTTDLKNTEINSTNNGSLEANAPSISPEQLNDIKKQIEEIKSNQKKADDALKEVEKDL